MFSLALETGPYSLRGRALYDPYGKPFNRSRDDAQPG
jgi:hypothetical protein